MCFHFKCLICSAIPVPVLLVSKLCCPVVVFRFCFQFIREFNSVNVLCLMSFHIYNYVLCLVLSVFCLRQEDFFLLCFRGRPPFGWWINCCWSRIRIRRITTCNSCSSWWYIWRCTKCRWCWRITFTSSFIWPLSFEIGVVVISVMMRSCLLRCCCRYCCCCCGCCHMEVWILTRIRCLSFNWRLWCRIRSFKWGWNDWCRLFLKTIIVFFHVK